MCALCGGPAMFTLLLLSCFAAAAAGPQWASPLAPRCGGMDCSLSASQSVQHTRTTLPPATEWASLKHRSDNTASGVPSGTTEPSLLRGETSASSHHPTPSASDDFSGHPLFDKLEAYFSGKGAEDLGVKHVTDEPTTTSSGISQRRHYERPHSKDVFLNKLYPNVALNGRHWSERSGHRSNSKLKKETSAHLRNVFNHKSSEPYNFQSGAVLRRSWNDHSSLATKGEVAQIVKGRALTLTPVSDVVVSLGHSAASKEEHSGGETARKSGIAPSKENLPSSAQPTAVPLQWYRSNSEGRLLRDYRPHGTPDTRERMAQDVTAVEKSESTSTDPTTLPSTSANEVVLADDSNSVEMQTPDPHLEEQKEEIEDAIARDATLIIVFSCLAVASLGMWRIVRCIAMHKLKKHEQRLAADKASSV